MDISKLYQAREKKIDVTNFFGEDAYITLRYIKRDVWKVLNQYFLKSFDIQIASEYRKRKKGKSEDSTMAMIEVIDSFSESELEEMKRFSDLYSTTIINHGVDENKHNLTVEGKLIKLDYDFFNNFGSIENNENIKLTDYIIEEIRKYNEGFDLGELTKPK